MGIKETGPAHVFRSQGRHIQVFHLEDGEGVPTHEHTYDHDILVASWNVRVCIGGINKDIDAGSQVIFQAGSVHSFVAMGRATVVSLFDAKVLDDMDAQTRGGGGGS